MRPVTKMLHFTTLGLGISGIDHARMCEEGHSVVQMLSSLCRHTSIGSRASMGRSADTHNPGLQNSSVSLLP